MLRYKPPDEALPLLSSMGPLPPFIWKLYFANATEDFIGLFCNTISQTHLYWAYYQQNPQVFFLMNGCQVRLFVIMQVVLFWANRMELPFFFFLSHLFLCFFRIYPVMCPAKMWSFMTRWYKACRPCCKRKEPPGIPFTQLVFGLCMGHCPCLIPE